MNGKEQQRVMVLNQVERGGLTGKEAAALIGVSLRQMRRLLAAYRVDSGLAVSPRTQSLLEKSRAPAKISERLD